MLRAAAISAVIVTAMAGLALTAVKQARRAEQQRRVAQEGQRALRRHLYATQTNLASQALETNNVPRALELLTSQRPKPGEEDLRGFEWRLLWNLAHRDDALATIHTSAPGPALAFSPDGRWLAGGGDTGTVRLYDTATRRIAGLLRGHTSSVNSLTFSPDGKLLATSSGDGTVRLWELQTRPGPQGMTVNGREVAVLRCPRLAFVVGFSGDGRVLVAYGGDAQVRVWQRATWRLLATLKVPPDISCLALSPDGRTLAIGGSKGFTLWNLSTRRPATVPMGLWVESVAFSPDGTMLATGGPSVKLWDVAARRLVATLVGRTRRMAAIAFSPDGRLLATGGVDNTIRLWSVKEREELAVLRGHRGSVMRVAFSPDGRRVASAAEDRTIRFWPAAAGEADSLNGRHDGVDVLAVSRDGKTLGTGGSNGVKLWDLTTRQPITPCSRCRMPSAITSIGEPPERRWRAW